jgi:hypothetical protein
MKSAVHPVLKWPKADWLRSESLSGRGLKTNPENFV